MGDFIMPTLGADMSAGKLVKWHKAPGDTIRRGDIVADVETDKGIIEVEVFTSGVLEELLVSPGAKVPVGTVLARIREEQEITAKPASLPVAAPAPTVPPVSAVITVKAQEEGRRVRASPSARQLAHELGVELSSLAGTGTGGAITREDVERSARAPSEALPAGATADEQKARMRQAIAAAMTRSKREIPHYYLSTTVDVHRALAWMTDENARRPVTERLLPAALLLKATALALREVPALNGRWEGDRASVSERIHLGVAISLRGGGLVAPALHDADRRSLSELMAGLDDLVRRARSGALKSSELADPTITVTNLGDRGVESVFGVIFPPQVALVGFGKIVERPWIAGGAVVPRPVVTATLSADHRVTDGHGGGRFLAAIDHLLQEPERL